MATVIKYKINGVETEPYREAIELTISALFGTETQPSLSLDSIILVDTADAKNSQTVRDLWALNPVEGAPFSIEIADETDSFEFDFYFDWTKLKQLSDIETEIGLIKQSGLDQFDLRAQAITQTLLFSEGIIGNADFSPVPYVVANRKTELEKIQIIVQTFIIIKSIIDEIFKIISIANAFVAGILSAPVAAVNLVVTLAAITTLSIQLKNSLIAIQESFFPPVRFHSGIKPKTFVEKAAVDYMNFDAVEFGTALPDIDLETWCGSKNSEKGVPQFFLINAPVSLLQIQSGLFKPGDIGYFLADTIQILMDKYRMRKAIIDNVLHLRPENDPFWVTNSGYVMPDLKIEQTFAENGTIRPNYEDVNASTIVKYAVDDSDLWTMEDLIDEGDPNTTGKIISVKTLEPINVIDQKKVILRGAKRVEIPHCLASRKDQIDDLLDLFLGSSTAFAAFKDQIEAIIGQFASTLGGGNPLIEEFINTLGNRTGAMKIEHDYFSVPKQMLLETSALGLPTIPADFADRIGAEALLTTYHSWDSFIPGERNPLDPTQTAAKLVYEQIRIPFGLKDFVQILNNAYFVTVNGITGKFTKLDWNVEGDFAICDYWIYDNWMGNINEVIT